MPTKSSWFRRASPRSRRFRIRSAVLFYDRLFEIAPSVKAMFSADMTEQRKKLMATLAAVVNGLDNLETVLPAASALAIRHVSYGVRPEHYPVVGAACCGLWKRDLAMPGRLTSRTPGPQLTALCPAI